MLYSIILLISPLLVIGPLFVIIVNPPDISPLCYVFQNIFSIPVISRSIYKPFRLYTHSPYEVVSGIIRYRCNEI